MQLISLQSGSSGNCVYVESRGIRLLFDAGLSATQVKQRLAPHGKNAQAADALFISHEHYDHIRCAAVYGRLFHVPILATGRTLNAARKWISPDPRLDVQPFRAGHTFKIGHLTIETLSTPHDSVDGIVFVVDDGRHRLGICTDLGHVFSDLKSLVKNVDGLFLESNYDEEMLANGPYPARLKERIHGPHGHISNRDAAELVAKHSTSRLQWLYLAHLSDKNNSPRKALAAHREALGKKLPIHMTSRSHATKAVGFEGMGAPQLTFDF